MAHKWISFNAHNPAILTHSSLFQVHAHHYMYPNVLVNLYIQITHMIPCIYIHFVQFHFQGIQKIRISLQYIKTRFH